MAHLQLTCLGDFAITLAGGPLVAFQTDKTRALLIYLVLEGQPHQRSLLAQVLWPGYNDESARHSLRQCLHQLRLLLRDGDGDGDGDGRGVPWLLTTRQTVQFNPAAAVAVDVTRFTQLLAETSTHPHPQITTCPPCLARLRAAVALYQGDFLAGFTVADSDPFEEWRRVIQEQLHLQVLHALTQLADAAEAEGGADAALQVARQQLALEPWLEAAHRRIMRILAGRGQRAAALAQYQRCRQVLAEELRAEPEAETAALAAQIQSGAFAQIRRQGDTRPRGTRGDTRQGDTRHETGATRTGESGKADSADLVSRVSLSPYLPPPPHNLPAALTPFVGRTRELAEIVSRLQAVRLLTLVGPGGMGKTRLALEVGHQQLPTYPDGVWFIPLAALTSPDALAGALASALGVTAMGDEPRTTLLHFLRSKRLLLILDNFEHLLVESKVGVILVSELLQAAAGVQILATSRARLQVRGEQIYQVQPLTFSPNATLAEATVSPAARLFVQSAQLADADFQLTAANLAAVLRICQLVQGMPLGLELAAAHVGVLPLTMIAEEIAQSAEFLTVDWADAPERQRSMRAVFDWSWHLLDQQERQVFRQLALFPGGFTREAAEIVAGATLPVLTRLVHKSLLQWSETPTAHGRYLIHELLRQFGAAELATAPETAPETIPETAPETTPETVLGAEATARRHSEYYLTLLATHQQGIRHQAPRETVQALQVEIDNCRLAWRWGAGRLPTALVEQAALTLREFYWLTGLTGEGIEMFTLAVAARYPHPLEPQALPAAEQQAECRLYTILLGLSANLLITSGRHEEALQQAVLILQLSQEETNPEGTALGYLAQGQALRRQGKSAEAHRLLLRVVAIVQTARGKIGNQDLLLDLEQRAQSWLCSIALSNDDYGLARGYAARYLEICQGAQKAVGEALALTDLVDIDKALGNYAIAQEHAEQALNKMHKIGLRWGEAVCLEQLAELAWVQGDYHRAKTFYEQALHFYNETNHLLGTASVAHSLGRLHLRLGDAAGARRWIDQAFHQLHTLHLPARETFWATLSRVWLSLLTADLTQALVDAEAGCQMAQQIGGSAGQAHALVLLGLVYERLHQAAAATTAYQDALTKYQALGHLHRTVEPRAGLARLALAGGALPAALAEVEEVLIILQSQPLAGFDEPFQVYLTCHTVFAANHDLRAAPLITTAHQLLVTYAARLPDPAVRRAFLEDVVTHRAVQAAFASAQEHDDKVRG